MKDGFIHWKGKKEKERFRAFVIEEHVCANLGHTRRTKGLSMLILIMYSLPFSIPVEEKKEIEGVTSNISASIFFKPSSFLVQYAIRIPYAIFFIGSFPQWTFWVKYVYYEMLTCSSGYILPKERCKSRLQGKNGIGQPSKWKAIRSKKGSILSNENFFFQLITCSLSLVNTSLERVRREETLKQSNDHSDSRTRVKCHHSFKILLHLPVLQIQHLCLLIN